jgi:hypothetical protein
MDLTSRLVSLPNHRHGSAIPCAAVFQFEPWKDRTSDPQIKSHWDTMLNTVSIGDNFNLVKLFFITFIHFNYHAICQGF